MYLQIMVSRGSSVRTVSDYGLDCQGSIPERGRGFASNLCIQTGSGAHPASYTMGTGGSFPVVKRSRGLMLTIHPLLVPRLRKSRSYTSSHPNAPLWSVTGPLYLYLTLHASLINFTNSAQITTNFSNDTKKYTSRKEHLIILAYY
jgi:hypothetical protein